MRKPEKLQFGVEYKCVNGDVTKMSEDQFDPNSSDELEKTGAQWSARLCEGWHWADGPMIGKWVDDRDQYSTAVCRWDIVFDPDPTEPQLEQLSLFD
jgi:hypothetical protein